VAPTTIQQLTGHANVQSINKYGAASNEMQESMSNILSNKQAPVVQQQIQQQTQPRAIEFGHHPHAEPSIMSASIITADSSRQQLAPRTHVASTSTSSDMLRDAKLANCTINVNYNYGPTPRKRIRVIDSDSD
jgi:hypothetical protein